MIVTDCRTGHKNIDGLVRQVNDIWKSLPDCLSPEALEGGVENTRDGFRMEDRPQGGLSWTCGTKVISVRLVIVYNSGFLLRCEFYDKNTGRDIRVIVQRDRVSGLWYAMSRTPPTTEKPTYAWAPRPLKDIIYETLAQGHPEIFLMGQT